jgi:pimeloyl-ACP methyl ester carboxylesterase
MTPGQNVIRDSGASIDLATAETRSTRLTGGFVRAETARRDVRARAATAGRVTARRVLVDPEFAVAPDGVRIAAYRFGGTGPPLVLAHATGFHAHVFLPFAAALRDRFSVFAFDLRGHGESEAPPTSDGYAWRHLGSDLLAVADLFGLSNFHAVGNSVGGAITVEAELTRPGTIVAAVLFEPIIYPPDVIDPSPMIEGARRRRRVFASSDSMLAQWSGRGPFASWDPEALRCYVEYGVRDRTDGGVELKCSMEAEVMTFAGDVSAGIWQRFPHYRTPTLIVTGQRDDLRRSQWAERQAAAMPRAWAERRDDVGHFAPLERPAEIAARTGQFLLRSGQDARQR